MEVGRRRTSSSSSVSSGSSGDGRATEQPLGQQPRPKSKSLAAARTSIHLHDPQLLRATAPSVLLAGVGRRMRTTAGGIGQVAETGDDAYAKSHPVKQIDIFLSHSWHTWWLHKYLTLVYYFNAVPAILATLFVSFVYLVWAEEFWGTRTPPLLACQAIGCVTFVGMLLLWHHIMTFLGIAPGLFLDKVCIHQTNAELKVQGIKSIGAIIANSKLMLVTWDSTYFERLWCTYEMSAFRFGVPDGKIKVLPVILGPFAVTYFLVNCIADLLMQAVSVWEEWDLDEKHFYLWALIHLPLFIVSMRVLARYIQSLKTLKSQLAGFSVHHAKCFCCDANHIHPDTGDCLPCDREVVNNSIESWMGLESFDQAVRGEFKRFVRRTLGGRARIPYRYAVAASMYPSLAHIDHFCSHRHLLSGHVVTWRQELAVAWESAFLRHPLAIALTVTLLAGYQQQVLQCLRHPVSGARLGDTAANWVLSIVSGAFLSALYYCSARVNFAAMMHGNLSMALWLLFETCCTFCLYFGGMLPWEGTRRVQRSSAASSNSPDGLSPNGEGRDRTGLTLTGDARTMSTCAADVHGTELMGLPGN